jgi:hypothetical protein
MGLSIADKFRNVDAHPFFKRLLKDYPGRFLTAVVREAETITTQLIQTTPIDTGAAAGVKDNATGHAKRPIYPKHPAYGMGGVSGGALGWKIKIKKRNQHSQDVLITNAMWEPYLQYVEYLHPTKGHFTLKAWTDHRIRMQSYGLKEHMVSSLRTGKAGDIKQELYDDT